MTKPYTIFVPVLAIWLIPAAGKAISIVNLDQVAHQISVSFAGESPRITEIAPNHTWRTASANAELRLLDGKTKRIIHARDNDEYAIWPEGRMGIQKRRKTKGATGF